MFYLMFGIADYSCMEFLYISEPSTLFFASYWHYCSSLIDFHFYRVYEFILFVMGLFLLGFFGHSSYHRYYCTGRASFIPRILRYILEFSVCALIFCSGLLRFTCTHELLSPLPRILANGENLSRRNQQIGTFGFLV